MPDDRPAPDRSAVGSASFRAMHVLADAPPHVLDDTVGLRLATPDGVLRVPPGMEPGVTGRLRASIVARARFIEDLVAARAAAGVRQYVILGAGLDTFVQRRPELAAGLRVFEVDRPGPQAWKRDRLAELGLPAPRFAPVDFEAGATWWDGLAAAGFEPDRPAVVASTGVSMYLSREAVAATLRQAARLAPGSAFVMSFGLPPDALDPQDRAPAGGPAFTTFSPAEVVAMAREAGFARAEIVASGALGERYLAGRPDGLWPSTYQDLLVAGT